MPAGSYVGIADHRDKETKHAGELISGLFYPAAILYGSNGAPYTNLNPVPVVGTVGSTPSGLSIAGLVTEVTLNAVTWTALPATALANRNSLGIQNVGGVGIKVNYSSGIVGYVGWEVGAGGEFFLDIKDTIVLYAKASAGTPTIIVMELS